VVEHFLGKEEVWGSIPHNGSGCLSGLPNDRQAAGDKDECSSGAGMEPAQLETYSFKPVFPQGKKWGGGSVNILTPQLKTDKNV
jgi:hypothetical protein